MITSVRSKDAVIALLLNGFYVMSAVMFGEAEDEV